MRTSVSTGAAAEDNLGLNRGWLGGWMGKGMLQGYPSQIEARMLCFFYN